MLCLHLIPTVNFLIECHVWCVYTSCTWWEKAYFCESDSTLKITNNIDALTCICIRTDYVEHHLQLCVAPTRNASSKKYVLRWFLEFWHVVYDITGVWIYESKTTIRVKQTKWEYGRISNCECEAKRENKSFHWKCRHCGPQTVATIPWTYTRGNWCSKWSIRKDKHSVYNIWSQPLFF
jgi:hypothetical protein